MPVSFCRTCRRTFAGIVAFDTHRTGSFTPLARRCMTVAEMRAAGMTQNEKGWWVSPSIYSTIAPKTGNKKP